MKGKTKKLFIVGAVVYISLFEFSAVGLSIPHASIVRVESNYHEIFESGALKLTGLINIHIPYQYE